MPKMTVIDVVPPLRNGRGVGSAHSLPQIGSDNFVVQVTADAALAEDQAEFLGAGASQCMS
jgi:hypothetical protein